MPVVAEFTGAVLKMLNPRRDWQTHADIPFELFVQTVGERTDIAPLMDVFDGGTPNAYHHTIAELLSRGELQIVLTTNFDTLLEKALRARGFRERRDYLLYDDPKKFGRIRWKTRKPLLIKLHGTIADPRELGVTLERVASRAAVVSARRVLAPLLVGGVCNEIYVAGYSFSDAFDTVWARKQAHEALTNAEARLGKGSYRANSIQSLLSQLGAI